MTKDFPSVSAPALSRSHRGQHNPQPAAADHADPRIGVDRPTGRLVPCTSCLSASSSSWGCWMPSPQVEKKLSGAGGQDSGSPSAQARTILGQEIAGLNSTGLQVVVHVSQGAVATDPQAQTVLSRATTLPKADHRSSNVITPQAGVSISQDGRAAVLQAGANADANTMVRAWAGAWHVRRQWCVTPTVPASPPGATRRDVSEGKAPLVIPSAHEPSGLDERRVPQPPALR